MTILFFWWRKEHLVTDIWTSPFLQVMSGVSSHPMHGSVLPHLLLFFILTTVNTCTVVVILCDAEKNLSRKCHDITTKRDIERIEGYFVSFEDWEQIKWRSYERSSRKYGSWRNTSCIECQKTYKWRVVVSRFFFFFFILHWQRRIFV